MRPTSKESIGGFMAADPPSKLQAALIIVGGLAAIGLSIYGIAEASKAFQQPKPAAPTEE